MSLPYLHPPCQTAFNRILEGYLAHRLAQGCHATTLRGIKPKIKHFLLYIANLGFNNLKGLEITDVNGYLPVLADSYGNIGDSLSLLRSFGAYLFENSLCSLNLESLFTVKVPNRKKIHSGFNKDEITAILNAPDRGTGVREKGLCDYNACGSYRPSGRGCPHTEVSGH